MRNFIFIIWRVIWMIILPVVILITIALFGLYGGIQIVNLFNRLARKNNIQVLKTSIDQIPLKREDVVTVEFIAERDEFYKFRQTCNEHGLWFLRPIWDAIGADKWVYSLVLKNKD